MMFTATHSSIPPSSAIRARGRRPCDREQPKLLEIGKAEVIQNFSSKANAKVALSAGNMNSPAQPRHNCRPRAAMWR